MKISFIMLFFVALQLHATSGYAQKTNAPICLSNTTIESVLNQIERNSNYVFLYNSKKINTNRLVSVKASRDIAEILQSIFAGTNVKYTIVDNQIILTEENLNAYEDKKIQLEGIVRDSNGEALIGVSVQIKESANGTITDLNGAFSIKAQVGNVLIVSYIGYSTQEIKINSDQSLNIILKEDTKVLDEVVVTALGIKRAQKALSYNVQVVSSDELNTIKDANFMNTLNGKVAGVTINASAAGAGGATRVVMRGTKSINNGNSALYVIDGVPIFNDNKGQTSGAFSLQPRGEGISDINPEDIESMSVLSGPAAAALYGSNAAQGVIIINTKKGSAGNVKVTISNTTTTSVPFMMPKFQNKYSNRNEEFKSWGENGSDYNYQPKNFFDTGLNIQNNISVSMGNTKNQTYLSVGTTNASGMLADNKYNRYNFSFRNTTSFLRDKMTLDVGFNYIIQNDANMMAQGEYYNPLLAVYLYPRGENFDNVRMFEEFDTGRQINVQRWNWGTQGINMQNPYWIAKRNIYGTDKDRYMANASLKYEVLDWLNFTGRVRIDHTNSDYYRNNYATTAELFAGPKGFYSLTKTNDKQVYADFMANINKVINDFSISTNLGTSFTHASSDMAGVQGALKDIPNLFNYFNIDFAGRDSYAKQVGWEEQTQSVFINAELGWKSMLYLTATARNDWASALANTEQLYFFYPSVGLSAVVTEIVKLPSFISYMKVRGSFAQVGSAIPRNLSQPGYQYISGTGKWETNTFRPLDKIYPEMTNSWEAGLSTKFFQNRVNLEVTWYKSNTKKQFINVPISPSSGYSSMYVQAGNVQNTGMEFALGFNNKWGDFSWNSNITFSFNKNKVIELINKGVDPVTGEPYSVPQMRKEDVIIKPGGSMGDFYITKKLKRDLNGNVWVNPKTGNLEIETLKEPEKVGSVLPKSNLGFRNDFSWKGISLGFMFTARFGGIVLSRTQAFLDEYGVSETSAIARDNGGIPINTGIIDAEKYYSVVGGKNGDMSQYIYNATNIRLQEASVGYSLPKKWFRNALKVDFSVVGRNLLMIYCKAPFDPELTPSTGTYGQGVDYFMQPSQRNLGFNIKIQF